MNEKRKQATDGEGSTLTEGSNKHFNTSSLIGSGSSEGSAEQASFSPSKLEIDN
jgi:hypothetical protein